MRIFRSPLVVCALACLTTSASDAAPSAWSRLPQAPRTGDGATSPRHQSPVSGLRLGRYRIVFEQTQWSDLQRELGPLKLRRQGDASNSETWTCFTVVTDRGLFQMWPSSGELQGGESIDGVIVQAGAPWPHAECPIVNSGPGRAALDNGVWIGTTRAELLKRLGPPTGVHGANLIYDFEAPVHNPTGGRSVAYGQLIFELRNDRVDRLLATKDTSD